MSKRKHLLGFAIAVLVAPLVLMAEDEHGHEESTKKHEHDNEKPSEHNEKHGEHEEEASSSVGPGKAIEEADPHTGFKLSEKATRTIELKFEAPELTSDAIIVPESALVFFKDEIGIYRLRDGLFKLIEGKLKSRSGTKATFVTRDINNKDKVVTSGVPLLRAAELEAWGGSGDGHGH